MERFADFAQATLDAAAGTGDLTVTVVTGQGTRFPTLGVGDYFEAWLQAGPAAAPTTLERIKVTARTGDVLTVVRAQDGTTASAFSAGAIVAHGPTARSMRTLRRPTASTTLALARGYGLP